ncbi:MAG: NAD-dependent epimerase/dehydratase family protein [Verrucomicrobia bacterium]|nr:NAD-dependent epimerase/dehydratase family protein [Verrucomicrobiota bacterium]
MHVLVLGAGYLGRAFAARMAAQGAAVTAVTSSAESAAELAEAEPEWRVRAADVSDPTAMATLAGELPAVSIALLAVSSGRGGAEAYRKAYVQGAQNLVAAFSQARLLYTGSTSVYAQIDGSWVDESSPAEPDRETGRLLLEAERHLLAAGGTVARIAGIYGPGRSVLLRKFLAGEAVLEGDGSRWINQAHRDDIVSALEALATHPAAAGAIFNVADDRPLTQRECYAWLAGHFQRPLPPLAPPDYDRKRGWTHKRVANSRLRGLGWRPRYPCFLDAVAAHGESLAARG